MEYDGILKCIPLPSISGLSGSKVLHAFLAGAQAGCGGGGLAVSEVEYLLAAISCCKLGDADAAVKDMSVALMREFWAAIETGGRRRSRQSRRQIYLLAAMSIAINFCHDPTAGPATSLSELHELVAAEAEILETLNYNMHAVTTPGVLVCEWIDLLLRLSAPLIPDAEIGSMRARCLRLAEYLLTSNIHERHKPHQIAVAIIILSSAPIVANGAVQPHITKMLHILELDLDSCLKVTCLIKGNLGRECEEG